MAWIQLGVCGAHWSDCTVHNPPCREVRSVNLLYMFKLARCFKWDHFVRSLINLKFERNNNLTESLLYITQQLNQIIAYFKNVKTSEFTPANKWNYTNKQNWLLVKTLGIPRNPWMNTAINSNYQLQNLSNELVRESVCGWVCGLVVVSAAMQHRDRESELNRASLSSVLISRLDGSHSSLDVLVAHVD